MTSSAQSVIEQYIEARQMTASELCRDAGIAPSTLSKLLCGKRQLGELAALKIEQATREAYASRRTDVRPLRREDLCPKLARTAPPTPAEERAA